ncbi:hypothetical protein OG689_40520 [Kitasatospora sp. NBC_00240]|uniref:scabin-related ADP-ribosyltransferase n=1 Tax=Kitasatospora sp. NBC_00240 TaxID=2903567 RepID=UPI00224E07AD|nr:hypothetical protein [Kitasatospora sp. NBC_00240]MCX5215460.1 hypothetical protein [Kitasatospora sp. NBC_00240]
MSLDLPLELRVVAKYVVGVWPSADEDVLRGLAGVYERVVVDAEGLGRALVWQSVGVRGWEGDARQAHDALMERVFRDSGIGAFVDAARSVAGGVRESAAQVEKAKYQVLVIAAWLAASIGWAVAVAPLTGGASLGWLAAVEAFAQELLARVGVWLVRAVAAAGAGALFMMSADGLSQGLVLARGHGGRFDVGELFMSGGMGALAGLVGLGVGAVAARGEVAVRGALVGAGRSAPVGGEVLFAPVWTGSLPARMGLQGLSGVVTGVGLGAVQGAPVTDTAEAFAQGVVGALAGRHGGVRAGKVPEGLAALVARLPGADGGGRFEPSEAVPDSGVGFSLLDGLWLEETSGGALWARPESAGAGPGDAAFASVVRSMGAGLGGPPLVVGTPGMAGGGVVRQLESVWGALQRAPRTAAALPREIVLAAPVSAHEMPALEDFVATRKVGVTISERPTTTGGPRSWTHLEPTDPADRTSDTITTPAPPPAAAAGVREVPPHPTGETASPRDITGPDVSIPRAGHPIAPTTPVGAMATPPDAGPPTNTATHHTENTGWPTGRPGIVDGVTVSVAAGDRSTAAGPDSAAPREVAPGPGVRVDGAPAREAFATVAVTADAVVETPARPVDAVREPPAWEQALPGPREALPTAPAAQSHEPSTAHTPARALLHGGPQEPTTTTSDQPLSTTRSDTPTQPTATPHDQHPPTTHHPAPEPREDGSAWQPAAQGTTGHAGTPYPAEHRRLNDDLLGLPPMDTIVRTLGKLPEQEYQHLMSRTDPLVAAPVLIGTDPATTRERALHEEDRQRVAFVLRRDGEESARNLAKNLGMTPGPGLRGGSDTYYHQSESESEGDDHTGYSQMYQHYVVRDDDDLLYRNDTRNPDEIFETGFQPRIPDSNVTLMDHIWTGPNRSQWVSTSRRDDLWRFGGYHYEIDAPGQGVDVEMTYGDDYPHIVREEEEVAFEGGIDRSFIIGADEQPIPGYGSGNFRAGEDSGSFYFVNPHFEFPAGGHQVGRNQNSDSDED